MSILVLVEGIGLGAFVLALLFLWRTLSSRIGLEGATDDFLAMQPEKYEAMERLLREDDLVFLAQQPGFSSGVRRTLRRQRRRIFRDHLRSLTQDFGRICFAVQSLVVHSAEDRGDLAMRLIRLRLTFGLSLMVVEARLLLHAAGMGTVDIRPLVNSLETVHAHARLLFAMPQTVAGAA